MSDLPWRDRKLHFIGIGGAGMSGLALIAADLGASVSGCDRSDSSYLEPLRERGIDVSIGHSASHAQPGVEMVVSTAIADDLAELGAAREQGAGVLHRSELLAQAAALRSVIAVSGTHGKTTTSAMIAHCLRTSGADVGYAIGAELAGPGGERLPNARWGAGEWFVVEADESDRSFLRFEPRIAVITNVELDHHSTYASESEFWQAFEQFGQAAGSVVAWDQLELDAGTRFGLEESSDVRARDIVYSGMGSQFEVVAAGESVACELPVPGEHNILNALAAIAACLAAGMDLATTVSALSGFRPAGRRFELLGERNGARVVDDYAHHPTEVAATLAAARALQPERLIAVFQPHLYSRTKHLYRQFGESLRGADEIVVLDVYPARERPEGPLAGVSGKLVLDAAIDARPGRPSWWLPTLDEAEPVVAGLCRPGTTVVTLGAGDVTELARRLVEQP